MSNRRVTMLGAVLVFTGLLAVGAAAATQVQDERREPVSGWHKLWNDSLRGANIERAWQWVNDRKLKMRNTVVVGIVDSGADTACMNIRNRLWTNPREVAGNGRDDDGNGYADDVHGWNFLGTRDGSFNMTSAGTEEYREFKRLYPKYKLVKSEDEVHDKAEYAYYLRMRKKANIVSYLNFYEYSKQKVAVRARMDSILRATPGLNVDTLTMRGMMTQQVADTTWNTLAQAIFADLMRVDGTELWTGFLKQQDASMALMQQRIDGIEHAQDKRLLMGDDMTDAADRFYGNATLDVEGCDHGTFVAGVVAGEAQQDARHAGIFPDARLMVVRVSPDGDEYDKDVAVGIRYAVDNGARVVNVSLGKYTSPQAQMVNDAIAYAAAHDVLIVAAAGNNHLNIDTINYYPSALDAAGKPFDNYIRVGATAADGRLSAISNYGRNKVDLYAPGEFIASVYPHDEYDRAQGTSVAAPVVSAIAAMMRAYYPKKKAADIKRLLVQTAHTVTGLPIVDAEAALKACRK